MLGNAIGAFEAAIVAIEKDPTVAREFKINEALTLSCEPPGCILRNCEVKFKYPEFESLKTLWQRIQKSMLVAQLFG